MALRCFEKVRIQFQWHSRVNLKRPLGYLVAARILGSATAINWFVTVWGLSWWGPSCELRHPPPRPSRQGLPQWASKCHMCNHHLSQWRHTCHTCCTHWGSWQLAIVVGCDTKDFHCLKLTFPAFNSTIDWKSFHLFLTSFWKRLPWRNATHPKASTNHEYKMLRFPPWAEPYQSSCRTRTRTGTTLTNIRNQKCNEMAKCHK